MSWQENDEHDDEMIRHSDQMVEFCDNVEITRWTLNDGSGYVELEKSEWGYLFSGNISGTELCDEDGEDFCFHTTDELLDFLKEHDLLKVLSNWPKA